MPVEVIEASKTSHYIGLSTDPKPRTSERSAGSTFTETDTGEHYIDSGNGWVNVSAKTSGVSIMRGIGERESMGTTASGEDITRMNELTTAGSGSAPTSHTLVPTPSSTGESMSIVSENDADNGGTATGVLNVRVHYLDGNCRSQVEDVVMNGTTPVVLQATDITFVNDLHSINPIGSGGVAAGHIKIYKTGTAGLVYNMIAAGGNRSLVPIKMVPFGHTLYLKKWHASEAQNKRCAMRIRSTDDDGELLEGTFIFKGVTYLKQSASGQLDCQAVVPAKSIVKVTGWVVVSGAETSCDWWGILVKD